MPWHRLSFLATLPALVPPQFFCDTPAVTFPSNLSHRTLGTISVKPMLWNPIITRPSLMCLFTASLVIDCVD